jgi:exodeoxyribonuclease VII large subunit
VALQTSPDSPVPVRVVSQHIGAWVHRLGAVWVEGQVTQLTRRPGARTAFLVLRDPAASVSLHVTCPMEVLATLPTPLSEGARVVVHAAPRWWYERGSLSLAADDIRPVGIGALLARVEELRRLLAAEGLFDADRKRRLPFVPREVGLVCGRASAAEHDVLTQARHRAPGIAFRVENVPVQGVAAVPAVVEAIQRLDADPDVEVIIVARGGGSVEDLLPFSDELLVRTVAACRTPVVSAIGHETDSPLLDFVADVRASTPTDAAKRVVPDVAEERRRVGEARARVDASVRAALHRERSLLAALRSRPVLLDPAPALVVPRRESVGRDRDAARVALGRRVQTARLQLDHARAQVRALSPAATLARGYAVVQRADATVLRSAADVVVGDPVRVRLAEGELRADVTGTTPDSSHRQGT